jgi:hypothetical protein
MEELRQVLFPALNPLLSAENMRGRDKSNRRPLTVDEKVCIGLMTMGGCTIGSNIFGFHVSRSTVYNVVWQFVAAVATSSVGEIKFPDTIEELQRESDKFKNTHCNHPAFDGCVAAGDGLAVRIRLFSKREHPSPLLFINRKGFASINVQGFANASAQCIYLSATSPGSTHDETAFQKTALSTKWKQWKLIDPRTGKYFWIALDDAYGVDVNRVCPWPGTGLATRDPHKDAFNYFFSDGHQLLIFFLRAFSIVSPNHHKGTALA